MPGRPLRELIDPGWADALDPVADRIAAMGDFLRAELAAGRSYLPAGSNVLRAFTQPFEDVRVLIVGQDPYPTPGHAVGLSFSVAPHVRPLPGSLVNIFREYTDDLGYPEPGTGDLSPWAEHGVLLLNRALTVAPHRPAAHRGKGWEEVTDQAIRGLAEPWYSTGGDPVGPGCAKSATAARRRALHRVCPPQSDVRAQRFLRLQAVQPREPAPGRPGRGAGRLEAALTRRHGPVINPPVG